MVTPWTTEQTAALKADFDHMESKLMNEFREVRDRTDALKYAYDTHVATITPRIDGLVAEMNMVKSVAGNADTEVGNAKGDASSALTEAMKALNEARGMQTTIVELQRQVHWLNGELQKIMPVVGSTETRVAAIEVGVAGGQHVQTRADGRMGTKEFVDLKQMRPEKLTGTDMFRKWREGFESYCELVETGMKDILKEIGNSRVTLTEDEAKAKVGNEDFEDLNRRVYNALFAYT